MRLLLGERRVPRDLGRSRVVASTPLLEAYLTRESRNCAAKIFPWHSNAESRIEWKCGFVVYTNDGLKEPAFLLTLADLHNENHEAK
jgi:hypothetical protein